MSSSEKELEEQIRESGRQLLNPPPSTEELLKFLDKAECLLTNVEQSPTNSMQDALLPLMKALISDELLKHSDTNVKVAVASCATEITRITAPEAPYDDDKMKVIFQLTIEAFEKLSNVSGRCYTRAISILDAVAKVRSCLVMLDLECDKLVVEMFQHFLKLIRSNHPHVVFSAMETIMTTVIYESEEISLDLLRPILASVRKKNQEVAPVSLKLGEKVMSNCAAKLQPYLMGAVKAIGGVLDDYAPIVATICQNEIKSNIDDGSHLTNEKSLEKGTISNEAPPVTERHIPNASVGEDPQVDSVSVSLMSNGTAASRNKSIIKASSRKSQQHHNKEPKISDASTEPDNVGSTMAENVLDSIPKKRGRKPNSLMNPEEGYDHSWIETGRKKPKPANHRKSYDRKTKLSPVKPSPEKATEVEKESSAHVEDKGIKSEDTIVRKIHEDKNKMEEKAQGSSRKSRTFKSKKNKTTLNPGCMTSEEKFSDHSDCKKNLSEDLVMKLRVKSTKENGSSVQKDVRVRSKGADMDENILESPSIKKRVSRSGKLDRENYMEETPKAEIGKNRGIMKEELFQNKKTSDAGEELVGRRIKVWWPMDKKFYEGVVHSFDADKKKHKVLYDDGDEEILNLQKQRYELILDDVLPVGDEEKDVPKPEASSDILKKRRRIKSESASEAKKPSSSRRPAAKKSEVKSAKSSGKSASTPPSIDKPVIPDESTADTSSPDKITMHGPKTSANSKTAGGELTSSAMEGSHGE